MRGRSFLHEFSHVVYGLALMEMVNNPKYKTISIPFDYPANGNFLSESFATAIEKLFTEDSLLNDNGWKEFSRVIDEYEVMKYADNTRNQKACSLVDNTDTPTSLFEAARTIHFILSEEDEDEFESVNRHYTKWDEPVTKALTQDEIQLLTNQIFEIVQPTIESIELWLKAQQDVTFHPKRDRYVLSHKDAAMLARQLEKTDFSRLREKITNPSNQSNSFIPSP